MTTTYTLKQLAETHKVSVATVRVYLCRAEFSHIRITSGIVNNMTPEDLRALTQILSRRAQYRSPINCTTRELKQKVTKASNKYAALKAARPLSENDTNELAFYKKQFEGAKGLLTSQSKMFVQMLAKIEELENRIQELEACK